MKNLSRRDFLKGAMAGAAGVAITGVLGACSSDTSASTTEETEETAEETTEEVVEEAAEETTEEAVEETAAEETTTSSSGDYTSWMTPPDEVTEFVAEYDTDVCVCGHGYAGICAARELTEEGLSCIVIEKKAESVYTAVGNEFAALNATILQERGVPEIDPVEFYQNFMLNTGNLANQDLVMKFALNSGETTDWYLSDLTEEDFDTMTTAYFPEADGQLRQVGQLKFWPSVCSFYGDCGQTQIQAYNRQHVIDGGNQVMFDTSAYYVIMEDGKVAGVVAEGPDGYIKINCKAAILATGGFGADEEMLNYFMTDIKGCFIEKNGDAFSAMMDSDGQGIKMAYWAGGHLETWGVPGMNMKHYSPSASSQATMPQALWLDHNCKRFCNEFYGTIEHRGRPTMFMNRDAFYVVFDKNFPEYRCHMVPQHGAWSPSNLESFTEELETAYAKYKGTYEGEETEDESGMSSSADYVIGDTIEELADNLELTDEQKENFIAAVERYNEVCEAGYDDDYGRDAEVLFPVNEAPFYAVKTTTTIGSTMVTMGGILTDGDQCVLDSEMEPIPGLYVSGNCCGRRFGPEYFTPIPGVSLAFAIVLGRECGKSAAAYVQSL